MNAPPKIDAMSAFMPWASEGEQDMRRRLRLCRELAAKRATYSKCDRARGLFWDANQAASEHTHAIVPLERLKDVRDACLRLFMAANAFERWEAGE
jgi:hypothetical protein